MKKNKIEEATTSASNAVYITTYDASQPNYLGFLPDEE